MRQGAATFHDLPAEQFDIDHVDVAAEGVFAIETKGFTKPNQGRGSTFRGMLRPSRAFSGVAWGV